MHALALDDARRLHLELAALGGGDRPLAVERFTERAHHPAEQRLAHRHRGDLLGSLDQVAFADLPEVAHDRHPDVVLLEVEHQPLHPVGELEQLARERTFEAVDARDAVADREHRAGLGHGDLLAVVLDLVANDSADLVGANFHGADSSRRGLKSGSCVAPRGPSAKPISPLTAGASLAALGVGYRSARRRNRFPGPPPGRRLWPSSKGEAPIHSTERLILVVEDDRNLRQLVVDILDAEGYEVRAAGNGKEAMSILKSAISGRLPDLIVLDLMLPKMNGWDLRAALQEDEALADIPVLVMSGIGPDLAAVAAEGHLHKPLDLDTFLTTVNRLCAGTPPEKLLH